MLPQPPAPDSPADAGARRGTAAAESARLEISYARRRAAAYDTWFDPSYRLLRQDRERRVLELLAREGLSTLAGRDILDAGCGVGNWLRDLVRWGATPVKLFGVDLLADRVETARTLVAPGVTVTRGDICSARLPGCLLRPRHPVDGLQFDPRR